MITITKERLLTIKQWRETYGPGSNVVLPAEEAEELARIALTSLEAEPVAYIFKHPAGKLFWALTDESNKEQADVIPVYAAAPASVVPDNASEPLAYAYKELTPEIMRNHLAVFERYGIAPNDSSTTIQALRIALDGIERSDAMLHGAEPVSQTYKLNELAGNSPVIPGEVLSAILKVARVRADFDDFDGDRRGIGDCLDEAEQELIVTINKYASQLAAGPIAPNDVREQTAVPPVPVIQADVAQAIEKLKRKLVECNRYNYCADAVKGVEYACHAAMLQCVEPASNHEELPLDYLQGQKDGLEWAAQLAEANHPQTGDWLYDDPLELAKAIRKGPDMPEFDGPTPGTPDGWISCSELMPDDGQHVIILCDGAFVLYAQYRDGEFFDIVRNGDEFFETQSRNVTHWMPLPEPPQEAK
ncbi:TPA: DUF551 domain-containing protein [Escherichia coli]|nr:DUF551 domain-containing protein [Escherichia coli]HCQ0855554.1 DUF551 domain-containing protein [Escherichia coli]